jgi:hypothetical protein
VADRADLNRRAPVVEGDDVAVVHDLRVEAPRWSSDLAHAGLACRRAASQILGGRPREMSSHPGHLELSNDGSLSNFGSSGDRGSLRRRQGLALVRSIVEAGSARP